MNIIIQTTAAARRRFDADALAWIEATEAADGDYLEVGLKIAYNNFIKGCKEDGTFGAMKAACLLAGARSLAGALTPIVGSAPTNFNFVTGDYNRKTGLIGDSTTKYLNTNRLNSADNQNNHHFCVHVNAPPSSSGYYGGGNLLLPGSVGLLTTLADFTVYSKGGAVTASHAGAATGLIGLSRAFSTQFTRRSFGSNLVVTNSTLANAGQNVYIFARNGTSNTPAVFSNARITFYSLGSNIDLALLDSRITTLISSITAAI